MRLSLHFTPTQGHSEALVTAFSLQKWQLLLALLLSYRGYISDLGWKVCLLVVLSSV